VRIGLIISLIVLSACSSQETKFTDEAEFKEHLNNPENGFVTSEKGSELIFETRLTPPVSGEETDECTINLRISRKDGGSVLEYGNASKQTVLEREGYLSFEVAKDVSLNIDGKSISPVFHHYERNYGLKPSVDMYFSFTGLDVESDAFFTYRDELFGQGLVKIKYNKELFTKCYVGK
jgi:hypothetical protein